MNSKKAFWISGAATLAVMLTLGAAINSKQTAADTAPTATQYAVTAPPSQEWGEQDGRGYGEEREEHEKHERHHGRERRGHHERDD